MHSDKDRDQSHDGNDKPDTQGIRGGGDVISKGGGEVENKEQTPQSGSAGHENKGGGGETVRTPIEP
jgi:hypothetical protein